MRKNFSSLEVDRATESIGKSDKQEVIKVNDIHLQKIFKNYIDKPELFIPVATMRLKAA